MLAVNCVLPFASNKASLLANILVTLSSHKVIKSESLAWSFCILPYSGFISFVIGSACINWFKPFKPLVELYICENIKPFGLVSSLYCSASILETFGPLSIVTALKSSRILFDSTPLAKLIQLYHGNSFSSLCSDIG